jgi:hypothetical protein
MRHHSTVAAAGRKLRAFLRGGRVLAADSAVRIKLARSGASVADYGRRLAHGYGKQCRRYFQATSIEYFRIVPSMTRFCAPNGRRVSGRPQRRVYGTPKRYREAAASTSLETPGAGVRCGRRNRSDRRARNRILTVVCCECHRVDDLLILAVRSFIALVASAQAIDWLDGIRTHWRSPTLTTYWFDGTPSKELRLRESGDGNRPTERHDNRPADAPSPATQPVFWPQW